MVEYELQKTKILDITEQEGNYVVVLNFGGSCIQVHALSDHGEFCKVKRLYIIQ